MKSLPVYAQTSEKVLEQVQSTISGLSEQEAMQRLEINGKNAIASVGRKNTPLRIFFSQFKSLLIIILIIAGSISLALGETIDAGVIYVTVVINIVVGFLQENKANRALEKLNSMIEFHALVLRDGKKILINTEDVVVGDILFIEAGDKIQADGRIIDAAELAINESVLTGESHAAPKQISPVDDDASVGDRTNMAYRGTVVTSGRGTVVITATGAQTEVGKIAKLVKDTDDDATPLQVELAGMSKVITVVASIIIVSVTLLGLFIGNGYTFIEMFETGIALAVAAVPESLAITLTVILSIGMSFIVKRKALVRRLVAAETLGSVTVICTDKTGTITEGVMRLTRLVTLTKDYRLESQDTFTLQRAEDDDARLALHIGAVANNSVVRIDKGKNIVSGDTTDIALLEAGMQAGLQEAIDLAAKQRISEIPFSSERKYMATLHKTAHGSFMYIKGAPEMLFSEMTHAEINGEQKKLTATAKKELKEQLDELVEQGYRLLLCGYKKVKTEHITDSDVNELTFVGFLGLHDPLRQDVKKTLEKTTAAGIKTIMITGDHLVTARAIGRQIGLASEDDQVFDGASIEGLSDDELSAVVAKARIFARVDPSHKIRIVQALQRNGEVVAMTGDGVNDAPALKAADIGVALGSGTDVAKETADMVLLDNAYSTIVAAVEEGRVMYQNVRKVVLYSLSGSFAETILVTASILAGLPLPALPVQIIYGNIIEDAFPGMALAFDDGDPDTMSQKPRKKGGSLITPEIRTMIIVKAIGANVVLFLIFLYMLNTTGDVALSRTVIFVGFGIDALFYIFAGRSMRRMVWQIPILSNKPLLAAVAFGWVMLIAAVYFPPLQIILQTSALSASHWIMMAAFGLYNVFLIEVVKYIYILKRRKEEAHATYA